MGLWVCRGIVEKLEGEIRCRTARIGGGTVTSFSIYIPVEETAPLIFPRESEPRKQERAEAASSR